MRNPPIPVALFVYARPEHTRRTLASLAQNSLAAESDLVVFADGPRDRADAAECRRVQEVRSLVRAEPWCRSVSVVEREQNWGLAANIVDGVSRTVQAGAVIVLEDDLVVGPGFLRYMNEALTLYERESRVMHVSAYMHPVELERSGIEDTFFYNVTSCWGWGTWARAWREYEPDTSKLLTALRAQGYDEFDFNGGQGDTLLRQLEANCRGGLETWAVKWHTSVYLAGGLCLHPKTSMVANVGFDGSGSNAGKKAALTDQVVHSYVDPKNRTPIGAASVSHREVSEAICRLRARSRPNQQAQGLRRWVGGIRRRLRRLLKGGNA